jgi:hypothetical protein
MEVCVTNTTGPTVTPVEAFVAKFTELTVTPVEACVANTTGPSVTKEEVILAAKTLVSGYANSAFELTGELGRNSGERIHCLS